MGLIKAAKDAVGSTLHDQWKDYIRCDDLGNEILMKKVLLIPLTPFIEVQGGITSLKNKEVIKLKE